MREGVSDEGVLVVALRVGIRLKLEDDGIHTESLACRRRAIFEDMAQVRAAPRTQNFGSHHTVRGVRTIDSAVPFDGLEEARPSAGAGELCV